MKDAERGWAAISMPTRTTLPGRCASLASGAQRRLRAMRMVLLTVPHLIVVFSSPRCCDGEACYRSRVRASTAKDEAERRASGAADSRSDAGAEAIGGCLYAKVRPVSPPAHLKARFHP